MLLINLGKGKESIILDRLIKVNKTNPYHEGWKVEESKQAMLLMVVVLNWWEFL